MLLSLCPNSLPSYPTLTISGTPIEQVQSFHYLGLSFTPKLSWSDQITVIAQKAHRLMGHLYRQFYKSCSSPTLLSLYFSIIRSVLEYSFIVWDPSSATHSSNLESVQYFALKVISKSWSSSYASLLSQLKVDRLSTCRLQRKLLIAFQIQNNLLHYPNPPLIPYKPPHHYQLRSANVHNLESIPTKFFNLLSFQNSFFPSVIRLWNTLPDSAKSTLSISEFKFHLNRFIQ